MSNSPRIISLVPSLTETLFDLDLQDQLVGRTSFCIHPHDKIASIPSVGGTKAIKMQKFKDLAPTHVLVNVDENPKSLAEDIEALGVEVVVTHPLTPEDNLPLFRLLGQLFGRQEQAEKLCDQFSSQMDQLSEAVKNRPAEKVLYLIWKNPWMTISKDTYISKMLGLINWQTVGHDPNIRYPEVTLEEEGIAAIDRLLLSTEPYSFSDKDVKELTKQYTLQNTSISLIDGEMTSWYGSRAIEGLNYLRKISDKK
ncbi:MAG: helical backbone metal receptor [Rhodospirillales bacterium]|nr:helical backbone metal receptor [Rhodospirillales bacterium]